MYIRKTLVSQVMYKNLLVNLILLEILLTGCASFQPAPVPTVPSDLPTQEIKVSAAPKSTQMVVSATLQPTVINLASMTSMPASPTPYILSAEPTLTIMGSTDVTPLNLNKEEILKILLKTDTNCRPPCLAGIHPGQTDIEKAKIILVEIGLPISEPFELTGENGQAYYSGFDLPTADFSFHLSLIHLQENNEVEGIFLGLWGEDIAQITPEYDTPRLLETLGVPSRSTIFMQFIDGQGGSGYDIRLFYDSIQVSVKLSGYAILQNDSLVLCPGEPNKYVKRDDQRLSGFNLYFQNSANPRQLEDLIKLWGERVPEKSMNTQLAIGAHPVEVFEAIQQREKGACFQTPSSLWLIK